MPKQPMDWAEAYRRPERARAGLRGQRERDTEHDQRVLEERARALARPLEPPRTEPTIEMITFRLGKGEYGLELSELQAVFRLREFTPVPGARAPIFGIAPWRGELLTILDLRALLGLVTDEVNEPSRVLVLGRTTAVFGILADHVGEIRAIPRSKIRTPAEGVTVERDFLRGITGEGLLVLDAAELQRQHR